MRLSFLEKKVKKRKQFIDFQQLQKESKKYQRPVFKDPLPKYRNQSYLQEKNKEANLKKSKVESYSKYV